MGHLRELAAARGTDGDRNRVHLLTASGTEAWPELSKTEVARRLADRIVASFTKDAA